ncbi:MAG: fimbrillin family protein [Alistipes inops]
MSAALLLGACAKEAPSGGRQPEPGEGAIRAVAEEVHDGAVSRSSFDENGRVAWSQGDVIGVMTADNTDANLTYRALTETDASQGLFTMEGDITLSGETFYAYYPMVPGNRLGADLTLPVTLPAVQTYRQGSVRAQRQHFGRRIGRRRELCLQERLRLSRHPAAGQCGG